MINQQYSRLDYPEIYEELSGEVKESLAKWIAETYCPEKQQITITLVMA